MSDTLELPYNIISSLLASVAAVATTWAMIRAKLKELETRVISAELHIEADGKTLSALNVRNAEIKGELDLLRQRDATHKDGMRRLGAMVVTQEVFESQMTAQNRSLDRIERRLDGGARTISAQTRASDYRVEPDSTPPVPPMRPRLPSRRDGE